MIWSQPVDHSLSPRGTRALQPLALRQPKAATQQQRPTTLNKLKPLRASLLIRPLSKDVTCMVKYQQLLIKSKSHTVSDLHHYSSVLSWIRKFTQIYYLRLLDLMCRRPIQGNPKPTTVLQMKSFPAFHPPCCFQAWLDGTVAAKDAWAMSMSWRSVHTIFFKQRTHCQNILIASLHTSCRSILVYNFIEKELSFSSVHHKDKKFMKSRTNVFQLVFSFDVRGGLIAKGIVQWLNVVSFATIFAALQSRCSKQNKYKVNSEVMFTFLSSFIYHRKKSMMLLAIFYSTYTWFLYLLIN